MITNLILSLGLSFAVGLNGIKENHNNYVEDNPTKIVYDDTNYQITLSADELNNYTWNNLLEYLNTISFTITTQIGNSWVYGENNGTFVRLRDNSGFYSINFTNNNNAFLIDFNKNNDSKFYDNIDNDNVFINNLSFTLSDTYYSNFKNAVELDIAANTTQTSMGNSIISAITSGLGLIGDLAREFLTGFSTLFWNANNSTLTSFGTFALVMLGVAITMAVISLVLNLIRGNTGA